MAQDFFHVQKDFQWKLSAGNLMADSQRPSDRIGKIAVEFGMLRDNLKEQSNFGELMGTTRSHVWKYASLSTNLRCRVEGLLS